MRTQAFWQQCSDGECVPIEHKGSLVLHKELGPSIKTKDGLRDYKLILSIY